MSENDLVFLHLSDIHFHKKGTAFDLDVDIRNEIERDIIVTLPKLGHVNCILVTGDVAYSGKVEEYQEAKEWLTNICKIVDCPPQNICVIPGNHDINWPVIDNNILIRDTHTRLREHSKGIDATLHTYLGFDGAAKLLFEPFENYNYFAVQYNCATTKDQIFWQRDFHHNKYIIRLRGVNSAIVSDREDDTEKSKLLVGSIQSTMKNQDGVINVFLCHHPPDWLFDQDSIDDQIVERTSIQLFGHKHRQRIRQIDGSVRVTAGACHPERNEPNWEPRYNFLSINVNDSSEKKELNIKVYARVWKNGSMEYNADFDDKGSECRSYTLPIKNPRVQLEELPQDEFSRHPTSSISNQMQSVNEAMIMIENAKRILVYYYLGLPYQDIIEIALHLDLLLDEDKGINGLDLYSRFIERAEKSNKYSQLWDAVKEKYTNSTMPDNPYTNK